MRIAFPTNDPQGMDSRVFEHFGTARGFIVVESETGQAELVLNQDLGHSHGNCQPLKALGGTPVEAVVVAGIGGGALNRLRTSGITVFRAEPGTVRENLDRYHGGQLREFPTNQICGGHGPGDPCHH